MVNKTHMKKSDRKQYDDAWLSFHVSMDGFMRALVELQKLGDNDFTVDDLNQISGRIDKITKTVNRIVESKNVN
jgi:hypothetical protein